MDIRPAPYYNNPQLAVKFSSVLTKMLIWGRGTGKTTIFGDELLKYVYYMPRSKGAFGGLTYFHVRTKSMPAIIDQWERRGIYRNIHYFVGHKAPKKFGWKEPFQPPLDYSNCVHFINGSVIEFISFDRPEMARSGSYDYMVFDEAAMLKKDALNSDVLPANRGNGQRFKHIRFHHSLLLATTQAISTEGDWIYEYEQMSIDNPYEYMFLEASAKENIHILGDAYFRNMKRILPSTTYELEVENNRRKKNVNGFYVNLKPSVLYFDSYNYDYYERINHNVAEKGAINSRGDKDCDTHKALDMSWDFGANINCCVINQEHYEVNEYRTLKNFFRENESYEAVCNDFIEYYQYHSNKTLFLYGGSDGNKRNADQTVYYDDVILQLERAGWSVINKVQAHEIPHADKYFFYIKYLSNTLNIPTYRINQNNAHETYVSMDNAPIKSDEIKKDKKEERNKAIPQWKTTHLSDAVDNVLYWKFSNLIDTSTAPSHDIVIAN